MKKTLFTIIAIAALISFQQIANAQEVNNDLVRVFRWLNTVDNNFVTLADGEIQEGQLLQWKYKEKTFLFYAYKTPGPDRVAIYRWTNPVTKDQASIAEDEFSDSDMQQKGYTLKVLQFYAPIRRAQNHIPVYNWYKSKSKDWVTIPEFGDTDKYWDKGYKQKKFQYYGIMRNEYEK
ncbi:MAG: hypothetical protein IPL09_04480 [Bacteroidetes bacterium]|jgi:hypothetical protein|nr:hypothetical protein [Bacteroidota bacterium]HQW46781.1 hypothetical protein [Chitinophagaceae bacterium]MBK6820285.1 hypothetical protein [Bacteroidota bacterium]MBK7041202.1 hypothetical protein [Bacteroidota bacterium]MBK7588580.1 hypothetical protein [Bacteroidota bacterium]